MSSPPKHQSDGDTVFAIAMRIRNRMAMPRLRLGEASRRARRRLDHRPRRAQLPATA